MSGKELMQQEGLLGTNEAFFSLFSHVVFHCVYEPHNRPGFILVLIGSPPYSSAFTQAFRGTRLN